jgi:endonuclease YncB( thermonuclease family)
VGAPLQLRIAGPGLVLLGAFSLACSTGIKAAPSTDTAAPAGPTGSDTGADTGGDRDFNSDPTDPLSHIDPSTLAAGANPCREPTFVEVTEVIDGDTIKVMTGLGLERVRLIGIDAAEVDHDGSDDECWAEEATDFVRQTIEYLNVWLTFDAECEDDYERTLAYVHNGTGDRGFFQRTLLIDGWVETFSVSPNTAFASQFLTDESNARGADRGLWAACRR